MEKYKKLSKQSGKPLVCSIRSSTILTLVLAGVHAGAFGWVQACALPMGARMALWAAVLASLVGVLRDHGLRRGRRAIVGFRLDGSDLAAIRIAAGDEWRDVDWRVGCIASWGVGLAVRPAGAYRWENLFIVRDAIDGDVFRRLRARLKARPSGV